MNIDTNLDISPGRDWKDIMADAERIALLTSKVVAISMCGLGVAVTLLYAILVYFFSDDGFIAKLVDVGSMSVVVQVIVWSRFSVARYRAKRGLYGTWPSEANRLASLIARAQKEAKTPGPDSEDAALARQKSLKRLYTIRPAKTAS